MMPASAPAAEDEEDHTNEQQNLAKHISSLGSPTDIAAFIMGIKYELERKNLDIRHELEHKIRQLNAHNVNLSNELLEYKNVHGTPATVFTCFPKLPAEIRIRIWNFALPAPRLVELMMGINGFSCFENRHPSILHVSKEAREEALKKHPLCEESHPCIPRFFNHDRDVLYISHDICWNDGFCTGTGKFEELFEKGGFDPSRLRCLAVESCTFDFWGQLLIYDSGLFPRLEEIILVCREHPFKPGPFKLHKQDSDDQVITSLYGGDGVHSYDMAESGVYLKDIISAFNEPLQKEAFEEQGSSELGDKQNPWLVDDRKPPSIRLLKVVPVSEEKSEFEITETSSLSGPTDWW